MQRSTTVVEVLGPWLLNKGDVLNLWAVATRLEGSSTTLAASSTLGLEQLPQRPVLQRVKWKPGVREFANAIRSTSPHAIGGLLRNAALLTVGASGSLRKRGWVDGREVGVLLDCSGYAYGDVWPAHRLERREAYYRKLKQQGALLVLLPQALGPFRDKEMRRSATSLFKQFDLIYARDDVSLSHLQELELKGQRLGLAPDITHLLPGKSPEEITSWEKRVCIVPNARMLDKTSEAESAKYLEFVLNSIKLVRAAGKEPWLLVHEANDLPLARHLKEHAGNDVPIVDEDALRCKGILGACSAVISSRYHAIVSALSQGVPVLSTSWSHKYDQLFEDYGCTEFVVSPDEEGPALEAKIGFFLRADTRDEMKRRLTKKADEQKAKVEDMWREVESLIAARSATNARVSSLSER